VQHVARVGGVGLHDGGLGLDRPAGVVLELRFVRGRLRARRLDQVRLVHRRDEHDQRHVDGDAARRGRRRALQVGDKSSAAVASWITTNATAGAIRSNPSGTPNRLLFTAGL
jgi:hypothetical protein